MSEKIDFSGLAQAALNAAEALLAAWLPDGRREGHEFKAINPRRNDAASGSFSININTGAWADFATDDKGGDLVALCAYLFHNGKQLDAAYDVAAQIGFSMPPRRGGAAASAPRLVVDNTKTAAKPKSPWLPQIPVPANASPPPQAHVKRGLPQAKWTYRAADGAVLGYIWRFTNSTGGKEIIPFTYCKNSETGGYDWRNVNFSDPRPLYGLDRLAAKPEATVLIVEGEKCADAADEALPALACVSWPGGSKAVNKVDLSPLAGRRIVIWPDCDAQADKSGVMLPESAQPGVKAALWLANALRGLGCKVWLVDIPKPGEKPSGWDVADAITEGLNGEELAAWVRGRSRPFAPLSADSKSTSTANEAGADGEKKNGWEFDLLRAKNGELNPCVMNVHDILLNDERWAGVLGFDEFAQRTVKLKPPPFFGGALGEWDSNDDTQTAMWLARVKRFAPASATVAEAVETLAKSNTFHPVRDWLNALPAWDGIARTGHWLVDYAGVKDSPYIRLISRYFLIGMIARIMNPGVKFDYCLVLEGNQGKGKSTLARILGGDWFGDTDLDLGNKDSMSALRGKWVYEFAEMGSVTRSEATRQKSFLSRQFDEFRPVYGRREIRLSRQVVFVGTTNEWEWNKDPTGGRRFWPAMCDGEFNLQGLRDNLQNLFAEALALFNAGEKFYPSQDEQKNLFDSEQLQREQQEGLIDVLHDWVYSQVSEFSIADAVKKGLDLSADKLTRDLQTRVGTALRKLGCTKVERRNGMVRYWYKPPLRIGDNSTTSQKTTSKYKGGDDDAPF